MNQKEQDDFEASLVIDPHRLDDACLEHPRLVWRYGRRYAEAVEQLDAALSELKVTEADLDAQIRQKPKRFGLDPDRITEAGIKRAILRSPKMQEAEKQARNAKEDVNMLQAANNSLDHKRTCLSMLDGQDARNYLSKPREGRRSDTGRVPHRKPLRDRKGRRVQ